MAARNHSQRCRLEIGHRSRSHSEIYNGETIDHRQEKTGWSLPGYDDAGWARVDTVDFSLNNLMATANEPVKRHETFPGLRLLTTPKGEKVIDFGQNLVGWVMVKLKGNAGDSITALPCRSARQNRQFLYRQSAQRKGAGRFYPPGRRRGSIRAAFHFSWVPLYPDRRYGRRPIHPADFTAVALYSDMPKTGEFGCSNAMINQLQHNIQWGQQGNFLDIPTDCPQRDERLGWTGDAQVFSRTAAFIRGMDNFFAKWLKDVAADQQPTEPFPSSFPM